MESREHEGYPHVTNMFSPHTCSALALRASESPWAYQPPVRWIFLFACYNTIYCSETRWNPKPYQLGVMAQYNEILSPWIELLIKESIRDCVTFEPKIFIDSFL